MIPLKQSTASQARLIGPYVDDTDGKTAETSLTIANTDIRLSKDGGNMAAKNSGGGTHDENGWYQVTFDATDTTTVGPLQVSSKVAGALAVWNEFWVYEEAIYDSLFANGAGALSTQADLLDKVGAVDEAAAAGDPSSNESVMQYVKQLVNLLAGSDGIGTNPSAAVPANGVNLFEIMNSFQARLPSALVGSRMDSNVGAISEDATAADNLEAQYDTNGITGDTFPATQSQLSGLANVGSAIHRPAASYVLTTGTQSANTVSSTEALDGTRHEHTDDAGAMVLYYQFDIGAGIASSCQVTGYLTSNNDDLEIEAFDWVASAWVRIGTLDGLNSATNRVFNFDLFVDMTGSGSNFGLVRVRFNDGAFTLSSATLAIDQIFVAFSQSASGYENGAVWYNSNITNTNTVPGVDGISTNPVSTMGAVNTLLASQNLNRVEVAPNSLVTFAAAQENQEFSGRNWDLALGGQSISNSHFTGADVSGTATSSVEAHFDHCEMGDCTLGSCHIDASDIEGTITISAASNYFILGCFHAGTAVLDFGDLVGSTTVHIHDYHGAITISEFGSTATDILHFSSPDGKLTMDSTCIGGTLHLNGTFDFVNSGSGMTINNDGHINTHVGVDGASAAVGDPSTSESLMQYIKQLVNVLVGSDGIGTWPASQDPANGVNIAEALRRVFDDTNELQGDDVPGLISALNDLSAAQVNTEVDSAWTTQVADSVATDGSLPTREQALYLINQHLTEFSISGTTWTTKKVDGSTTLATFTLDDATNPTSMTRAS